ncbi:hypothetical protein [Archangium sp.]|uniref:hypothetical protein n=1 Tax=Archangium sp. TaxID=1872627 RepID=UPI002D6E154A|nr:hypothetical protein [Archangium sp.]HYO51775.1 hypothetical protein [Archangium sp.]
MAETMGGDIGVQILQAVKDLGVRMDRLEARMDRLEARMDRLEARMDGLESQVNDLRTQVNGLTTQVNDLGSRMTRQETLMEILGAEFINWREGLRGEVRQLRGEVQQVRTELKADIQQVRTEMHEGFRRFKARLDLTDGTVILMASVLRRPTELGEDLESHLREIEAR